MRAATLLVLFLAGPAVAQCVRASCGYQAPYVQSYYQPQYVQQYVAPVNYAIPHVDAYTQTAVVGKAYPVYLPLLAYSSVADDVRSYYSSKRSTKEAFLEAFREAAAEGLLGPTAQPIPQAQPGPLPPSPPPPVGVPQPGKLPEVPKAPGKGQVSIKKILTARCAECHNPQYDASLTDLSGDPEKVPGPARDRCVVFVTSGKMPKGKGPIPQEEYDTLVSWALAAGSVAKAPAPQPADKK